MIIGPTTVRGETERKQDGMPLSEHSFIMPPNTIFGPVVILMRLPRSNFNVGSSRSQARRNTVMSGHDVVLSRPQWIWSFGCLDAVRGSTWSI